MFIVSAIPNVSKEGDFMEQQVVSYIKKHTFVMTILVVSGFFLLAMGQLYLYKQQMYIKQMISEGFMQVKEMK